VYAFLLLDRPGERDRDLEREGEREGDLEGKRDLLIDLALDLFQLVIEKGKGGAVSNMLADRLLQMDSSRRTRRVIKYRYTPVVFGVSIVGLDNDTLDFHGDEGLRCDGVRD